jgi:hypothetical protein
MLSLKPRFVSDWKYERLLFRSVTLGAVWKDDDDAYVIDTVNLSDRPRTPSGLGPDLRRKPVDLNIGFEEFNKRVKSAVEQAPRLVELKEHYGSHLADIMVPLSDGLQMTPAGVFLEEWTLAPIVSKVEDAKLAAMAVLDMLEIEATLPSYRL